MRKAHLQRAGAAILSSHSEGHGGQGQFTQGERSINDARRDKPHVCDVKGCDRGFSSPHDLRRHQRSRHGIDGKGAEAIYYKCTLNACQKKDKRFSRLDNFNQHLDRVHGRKCKEDMHTW